MQHPSRRLLSGAALSAVLCGAKAAMAQVPRDWQFGMQTAHSPVQVQVERLHDLLLVIITLITLFVAGLLGYVAWRFNAQRHPQPSRFSHNTTLEVAWTLLPVLILVAIAIPSFRLIYYEDRARNPDMTLKVTGHQWFWEYTYPDQGGIDFSSIMVPVDELKPGQKRLLDVDNPVVLPVGKKIRILTTSADVIHSFFVPSLGVQRYAIPGHTIETWVEIDRPGHYYGECNQICGTNHSFMPISVVAMTQPDFDAWAAKTKTAMNTGPGRPVAVADAAPVPAPGELR